MPDYGHDLRFGSFITPQAARPERAVELARLSEEAGLDLVTFQDHPYQPAFLDTWTLLTWVAARTERIHLSGNVLNLPLRPPAVLARSVASLDLLSGGRVELGLGAGAFWDAVAAMGGRRLTPGQAVDALSEAIDVIRGVWDAGERRPLKAGGAYHRVDGAKRGPAPAHHVPIWLGAYKPRMLRLVGEKADGWLPSLGYATPEDITAGNKIIDEAAAGAGRDPREIRRLLNLMDGFAGGPAGEWVERLLPLVVEDGISTFILAGDDPGAVERLGRELAPALREAVAAERATRGAATGPARPPRALSLRRPGIDYDALPASLADRAVEPGDREYERVRSTYVWPGSPGLVLRPATAAQVAEAVAYARGQDVPLAVRSGGHGISGRSTNDGGIVVDVGALDTVEVLDRGRGLVRVGAGARWGDVAQALTPHGLAISSGDYGDVGVGGLATAGGQGFLARSYGLTLDHVVGADVVLADGRTVRADAGHHPDLFWGLRGAGGNLGVVTSFDIEAAELADVVFAVFVHDASDTAAYLESWGRTVEASPRRLTPFTTIFQGGPGQGPLAQTLAVWAGDDTDEAVAALEPFLEVAPVLRQEARLAPYAAVVAPHRNRHTGQAGGLHGHSALVDHLDAATTGRLAQMFGDGLLGMLQVRSVGGAVNDVDPAATAYAHRTQNFSITGVVLPGAVERAERAWDGLNVTAAYLSFEPHFDDKLLTRVFPPPTLERLRRVKAAYDPGNVFRHNFPITPA
ncbi:LLM class flavin-dependent oxidoreductase [Nonomuraea sp. MCN248]|uniref:LLM class flavin-dependent oxidoreductase n=1 Tax=Nonomuraea corallina TaxID=2989783 RepID=A0ABT4S8N1_9ACTN|nr:LLM class flavin-dependent oxidoreductase [Nonomuraea corallina]MDA0633529.1 LLM class flavin-dependent oxidoreductase [Nonomuraea corallina]